MSKKNYTDGSLKLVKHAIQQKKLYRIKFVDGNFINTQITDTKPVYDPYIGFISKFHIKTPRSYSNIFKYNSKYRNNDYEGKKYNTDHILHYELIDSSLESVSIIYEYDTKGWFFTVTHQRCINISWGTLVSFGYDINKLEEDFLEDPQYEGQYNNLLRYIESKITY